MVYRYGKELLLILSPQKKWIISPTFNAMVEYKGQKWGLNGINNSAKINVILSCLELDMSKNDIKQQFQ
jgi:hypothetical protein